MEKNCEMTWKITKKGKLNSDKIWKKYGRKASRIVKRFGQYGRKIS